MGCLEKALATALTLESSLTAPNFLLFSRQRDAIKYLLRFKHKQQNKNYIITQRVDLTIYSSYITQGSIAKRRTLTQAKEYHPRQGLTQTQIAKQI